MVNFFSWFLKKKCLTIWPRGTLLKLEVTFLDTLAYDFTFTLHLKTDTLLEGLFCWKLKKIDKKNMLSQYPWVIFWRILRSFSDTFYDCALKNSAKIETFLFEQRKYKCWALPQWNIFELLDKRLRFFSGMNQRAVAAPEFKIV